MLQFRFKTNGRESDWFNTNDFTVGEMIDLQKSYTYFYGNEWELEFRTI